MSSCLKDKERNGERERINDHKDASCHYFTVPDTAILSSTPTQVWGMRTDS